MHFVPQNTVHFSAYPKTDRCRGPRLGRLRVIDLINVSKNILKADKNSVFIQKLKKNVCKRDRNVTLFLRPFDVGPI